MAIFSVRNLNKFYSNIRKKRSSMSKEAQYIGFTMFPTSLNCFLLWRDKKLQFESCAFTYNKILLDRGVCTPHISKVSTVTPIFKSVLSMYRMTLRESLKKISVCDPFPRNDLKHGKTFRVWASV